MRLPFKMLLLCVCATLATSVSAAAECSKTFPTTLGKKIGIVVSNSSYAAAPLRTPQTDADAIAEKLDANGYSVICFKDQDSASLRKIFKILEDGLFKFDGDLFIYLTGHGWNDGRNSYFIGVDSNLISLSPESGVGLDQFVQHLSYSKARQIVFIFDICRSFAGNKNSIPKNVESNVGEQKDIIVAYSAGFGTSAFEGTRKYSPFGGSLAAYMQPELGFSVQEMLELTARNVKRLASEQKTPKQIPSNASFSARQLFLDTRYTGLKGLTNFGEAESLGITPIPSEDQTPPNDIRSAELGVAQLIKKNKLSGAECQKFFSSKLKSDSHVEDLRVQTIPRKLVSDSLDRLYVVFFAIADPCVASADGNSLMTIIGLPKGAKDWRIYFSDMATGLATKAVTSDYITLVSTKYVGASQVSVKTYFYDSNGLTFVPNESVQVPVAFENGFFAIDNFELLGDDPNK
jgi:hypothetical protein